MKIILRSGNRKLSRDKSIVATYRKVGATCPTSCSLLGNGCYAQRGFVGMVQPRQGDAVDSTSLDCVPDDAMVRLLVSGDILTGGKVDSGLRSAVRSAVSRGLTLWGYTHAWKRTKPTAWKGTLLASVDSWKDALLAKARGWKTARVVPSMASMRAPTETLCPYDVALASGLTHDRIKVTCSTCRLCFPDSKADIVFVEH